MSNSRTARFRWWGIFGVLALVAALMLFSCSGEKEKAGEQKAPSGEAGVNVEAETGIPAVGDEISLDDLRNGSFDIGLEGLVVTLQNGEFESRDADAVGVLGVGLTDKVAFGDLNGDGVTDAAAVLWWSDGGSGSFYFLTAVVDRTAYPINVGNQSLGDRVDVKSIEIDDGVISVEMLTHSPSDPMCCPTLPVTRVFRLKGTDLVEM
jgi:hypothetical protein